MITLTVVTQESFIKLAFDKSDIESNSGIQWNCPSLTFSAAAVIRRGSVLFLAVNVFYRETSGLQMFVIDDLLFMRIVRRG